MEFSHDPIYGKAQTFLKALLYGALQLRGILGPEMGGVDHPVVDQRVIDIIDRNQNTGGRGLRAGNIFFDVADLGEQNPGQLLFQNIRHRDLQVFVDGQIHIFPGFRLRLLLHLQHISHAVHIDRTVSLGSLEFRLHILLDSGLSHDIIELIVFVFQKKAVQLLLGRLSDIADQRSEIFCVRVYSQAALGNIHSLKHVHVLHDLRHGFVAYVRRDRSRHIALVAVQAHGVADRHDLQPGLRRQLFLRKPVRLPLLRRIGISGHVVPFAAAQVLHDLVRRGRRFLRLQLIDGLPAVDIRLEPHERGSLLGKYIPPVFIQNPEIADDPVPMGFHDLDDPAHGLIQLRLFLPIALIRSIVLYGDGIRQRVVRQDLSVPVIDFSSGTGDIDLLFDLHGKAFRIIFPIDNLKKKHTT